VVGHHRSSQRHVCKVVELEAAKLRHRLREVPAEQIRWGQRIADRPLQREGWTVNLLECAPALARGEPAAAHPPQAEEGTPG